MESALADPLIGRTLDQRYLVRSRIAHGGMATVYLATDIRLDRQVALKVMHADLARDEDFVSRFIGEAKSVARLSNPNIVSVFDQGADGQVLYLAMEYVPGRTLRSLLSERGWFPCAEALAIMEPILSGLAAAHRAGIVHRDVKPENVLLTGDGRVKVVDFGLARARTASSQTRVGQLIGTVAYIAPEQVTGGVTDFHTDVYAAGVMLFEMLTGRQPHTGESPLSVAYKHVNEEVPPPSVFAGGLPPAVDQLVRAATSRNPRVRPANAEVFLNAVRSLRGLPAASPAALSTGAPLPAPGAGDEFDGGATGQLTLAGHPDAQFSGPDGQQGFDGQQGGASHTMVVDFAADDPYGAYGAPGPYGDTGYAGHGHWRGDEPFLQRWLFSKRLAVVAVGVIVLVAAGFGGWWLTSGRYVTLPRVTDIPEAQAVSILHADGFAASEAARRVTDDSVPKGYVISASPTGRAPKGSTIALTISAGPRMIVVPSVAGQTLANAEARLRKAGLKVAGTPDKVGSTSLPAGAVAGTTPPANTSWPDNRVVHVDVVAGIPLPPLTGQNINDVQTWAGQNNIQLNVQQVPNSAASGTIISQSIPAGTPVSSGQTVTVQVSSGPPQVGIPNVGGQSLQQATQALQQAGFKVNAQQIGFGGGGGGNGNGGNGGGHVIATNPSGQAPQGTTITVYYF